jgi:hypothetical protein
LRQHVLVGSVRAIRRLATARKPDRACLAAGDDSLEIRGQPPVAANPGKGSFDDPAPWKHFKTLGLVRSLDDLERPLPMAGKSGL